MLHLFMANILDNLFKFSNIFSLGVSRLSLKFINDAEGNSLDLPQIIIIITLVMNWKKKNKATNHCFESFL